MRWTCRSEGGTGDAFIGTLTKPYLRGLPLLVGGQERQEIHLHDVTDVVRLQELKILTWDLGGSRATRSRMRLPGGKLFCHDAPLLRRSDISLQAELEGSPLRLTKLSRTATQGVLDLILETSAVRYRELYGFSHPDAKHVWRADFGRGVRAFCFGVPPEWRLPLRAYHCALFFKNGVPIGYVEVLSLFEHAEVGFNIYYTFREGESAWLYARVLRLLRQWLGVKCFAVDPYQLGHHNDEAIDAGAFWFYRKLGLRPVVPELARLAEREEQRIRNEPRYRTGPRTLRKLAAGILRRAEGACGVPGEGRLVAPLATIRFRRTPWSAAFLR